jgi:uncharacterized protein (TIGR00369 family)
LSASGDRYEFGLERAEPMNLVASEQSECMGSPRVDNPMLDYLGAKLVAWDVGRCEFELMIGAHHLNRRSSLQGGVVATLLDAACGYAGLITSPNAEPGNASTVMLTISYLDKVASGRIRAVGRVIRSGRTLYFSTGELLTEDGRSLATAQGAFKRARDGGA